MKALTLRAPYGSFVEQGRKTIETRSWSTAYRGPLLIHQGLSTTLLNDLYWHDGQIGDRRVAYSIDRFVTFGVDTPLVTRSVHLGAIVASCTLIDCVPMVQFLSRGPGHEPDPPYLPEGPIPMPLLMLNNDLSRLTIQRPGGVQTDVTDQLPFGDFSPGRFAWLLGDVKPTTERCPRCWGRGMLVIEPVGMGTKPCPTCAMEGSCAPVPASGRQGLWTWTL